MQCVKELKEVFADFYAIDPHLFVLNTPGCVGSTWEPEKLARTEEGIRSFLLGFGKHPVIRYGSDAFCFDFIVLRFETGAFVI
jgi:hypothetical protein